MTREVRRERGVALRRRMLLAGWILVAVLILLRSARVQVGETASWREAAAAQHRTSTQIPAARGAILDRDGAPLVVSREIYRVSVAPRELTDRDEAVRALQEVLGITDRTARRVTDPGDPWHVVPGRFDAAVREGLAGIRGIHLEKQLERFHPHADLGLGVLGRVIDGNGTGGIEESFDDVLRGVPGRQVLGRDHLGRPIPGEVFEVEPPRPGGDVRLTLDVDLQEIAHEALGEAMGQTGARGGDLIVTDPMTGEILALVSMKEGRSDALSAINAPYEPGSTLKPFTVTALLKHGLASLQDSLDAEKGYWIAPDGRPLRDVHGVGRITLAHALRVSSNVGVAKAALRLSPAQQYENLRDFGFGVATGIPLPGEVPGLLRKPERWTARSPVSLAIGYETSVTPLQMAMAYGALANGGRLMEPRLVRGVRRGEGLSEERFDVQEVRRIAPAAITREVARVLVDVVEDGTGTNARLGSFAVAGKSGTSRAYVPGEGYASGRYFASFAGFFPADDPQLVVFVKLDSPRGSYYGGATAAPVTRATMEAALAARQAPLDRSALIRSSRALRPGAGTEPAPPHLRFASLNIDGGSAASGIGAVAGSNTGPATGLLGPATGDPVPVTIPDVAELPARIAVRRLHALGLRVRWEGAGAVLETHPAAGQKAMPGDTILVRSRPGLFRPSAGGGRR